MNALVDEVAKKNSDVAEMLELERLFKMDPLLIRRYMIEERAHIDYVLNMKESHDKGLEAGRKDSARKLRLQGILSDEQIAEALDMPIEVVKAL